MMKRTLLVTGLLAVTTFASVAQTQYVKQYFITTGGNYRNNDNKVAVSVIKDGKVQPVDSVEGNFSNIAEVYYDGLINKYIGIAHIGGAPGGRKDLLIRYDMDTYEKIDFVEMPGARAVARNATKLIVAKNYGAQGAMVDILDANTLAFVAGIPGITNLCTDVKILGDSAFVSHSLPTKKQSWVDSVGYLSIIRLSTATLMNTINLGSSGKSIDKLIVRKEMDSNLHIYFSNQGDSTRVENGNLVIHNIKHSVVVEVDDKNIFGVNTSGSNIGLYSKDKFSDDLTVYPTKIDNPYSNTFYYDRVNKTFLTMAVNYAGDGKLYITNPANSLKSDSVNVGMSATALAVDYRTTFPTALNREELNEAVAVFPNPCKEKFTIRNKNNTFQRWSLKSADGQEMQNGTLEFSEEVINTESLQAGMYVLTLKGENVQSSVKVIRQ